MRAVTVTEVRRYLYWASGGQRLAGASAPSLDLLGRLFHDVFGVLTGGAAERNLVRPLGLADSTLESWQQALVDHAYTTIVAPALASNEVVLQNAAQAVIDFWTATRALCAWLATIMHGRRTTMGQEVSLAALRDQFFAGAEVELVAELTDIAWPEPVLLQGRADAVLLRHPDARYCLLEVKLGRTYPQADLLQGCLYQMLLASRNPQQADAALAMLTFDPLPRQRLYEAGRLRSAQAALKAIIAELVGFGRGSQQWSATVVNAAPTSAPVGDVVSASDIGVRPLPATELEALRSRLISAFTEYGAPLKIAPDAACGPAFIRFYASPQRGVSVTSIGRLSENVWRRLQTSKPPRVSLEKGRIAIDIERPSRVAMTFEAWASRLPARNAAGSAQALIGVTVDGALHTADLSDSQSPHLLVVGSAGSGKSEWLRAFLASLMLRNSPATLRFALLDPKHLAFSSFENSPYLWKPVVHKDGAIELFDALVEEMERRYVMLQRAAADDLTSYNGKVAAHQIPGSPCPRIVCVCDEFADLLLRARAARRAIEERVARLGVKGRAAGVHLVFATQRAGREILKDTVDSNLPARVALAMPRGTDSRLVLGETGAETLLGKGDLLYKDIGAPVRLQGLVVARETLLRLAGVTQ